MKSGSHHLQKRESPKCLCIALNSEKTKSVAHSWLKPDGQVRHRPKSTCTKYSWIAKDSEFNDSINCIFLGVSQERFFSAIWQGLNTDTKSFYLKKKEEKIKRKDGLFKRLHISKIPLKIILTALMVLYVWLLWVHPRP